MRSLPDRYKTVGRRDFASAVAHMLETEFKLVGSHRVIRMIVESIMELHRKFFPETKHRSPGTILWATTKAGEGAKVSWGKRAEEYGIQLVQLPLVTKAEIESRMIAGPGRDPKDNRRKEFTRDMATAVRLLKSAAEQGGLLSGAELSVLMNRTLSKVQEYVRTYEEETGDPEARLLDEAMTLLGHKQVHYEGLSSRVARRRMVGLLDRAGYPASIALDAVDAVLEEMQSQGLLARTEEES